jgi:hypothetical protein
MNMATTFQGDSQVLYNALADGELVNIISLLNEKRSFTDVSVFLKKPTSFVSKKISTCEKSLGLKLFQRTTRTVAPTAFCDRFLKTAREVQFLISKAANGLLPELSATDRSTVAPWVHDLVSALQLRRREVAAQIKRKSEVSTLDIATLGRLVTLLLNEKLLNHEQLTAFMHTLEVQGSSPSAVISSYGLRSLFTSDLPENYKLNLWTEENRKLFTDMLVHSLRS